MMVYRTSPMGVCSMAKVKLGARRGERLLGVAPEGGRGRQSGAAVPGRQKGIPDNMLFSMNHY